MRRSFAHGWAAALLMLHPGIGCGRFSAAHEQVSDRARAGGFNLTARARFVTTNTGTWLWTTVLVNGPTHHNEIVRFDGTATYTTSDGKVIPLTVSSSEFAGTYRAAARTSGIDRKGTVQLAGHVRVYRRTAVKAERQVKSDRQTVLHMNTGTVTFTRIGMPKDRQVLVNCKNLGAVHEHGLELLMPDKKSIADRFILSAAPRILKRETIPFISKETRLEPIIIHQLVPKRTEPVRLRPQIL